MINRLIDLFLYRLYRRQALQHRTKGALDPIDGSPATHRVVWGDQDRLYTIDLSDANFTELEAALTGFRGHATTTLLDERRIWTIPPLMKSRTLLDQMSELRSSQLPK